MARLCQRHPTLKWCGHHLRAPLPWNTGSLLSQGASPDPFHVNVGKQIEGRAGGMCSTAVHAWQHPCPRAFLWAVSLNNMGVCHSPVSRRLLSGGAPEKVKEHQVRVVQSSTE